MAVRAVVFDIGNVLIEWQPERFYDRIVGEERRRAFFAAVPAHAMNDRIDMGEGFECVVDDFAAQYPDWAEEIAIWHSRWIEIAAPAIDHSVRLLRALRRAGHPVFALTNFGKETFEFGKEEYPFLEEFDRHYISGHMGVIKPDPEIYAQVEADCGVAPDELLFADDRIDNVNAASLRGWNTHLFDGPEGWAARLVAEGLISKDAAE